MSESHFDNALTSLKKSIEIEQLHKALSLIRKEVEWPSKKANIYKIQEKGCLKSIVDCLLKRHVPVVNTSLSILGNCCMVHKISQEIVKEHNVLNNLNHVLKGNLQDSIRGRVYRVLGNICQHGDYYENLLVNKYTQLQIISNIVTFLKQVGKSNKCYAISSKTILNDDMIWSNATVCMAIRTLRELVNTNTVLRMVHDYDVVKAIGMLLIRFTPEWINTRQHEDVLEAVLKLLHVYSNHNTVNLIPELQNCGTGNAMDFLGKLLFLSPYVLVKIVMNLLKSRIFRSDVPIIDMSENLVQKLGNPANFTNGREDLQHREYLKCLCFLMHNPSIIIELRNAGLIALLVSILNDYQEETEVALRNSILILSNLRICMCDYASLQEMLKCDIINALVMKLNWAVGADGNFDLTHTYRREASSRKRRKYITDKCFMHQISSNGIGFPCCFVREEMPYSYTQYNRERSMSPTSDISFSSGPSSPSNPILSDDEDSDDYSPVCSDNEDNVPLQNLPSAQDEEPSPYYEETENSETKSRDVETAQNAKKRLYTLCLEIIKMVKLFTRLRPFVSELATTNLLVKLLHFLIPKNANICPPNTLDVIFSIVKNRECLLQLMQTDFTIAVYKFSVMSHSYECVICANLCFISRIIVSKYSISVDSDIGEGDIAHQLHRASLSIKQKLVSSIPFVTGSKYIFCKLMIDCGGLDILIQAFQEQSSIQLRCILSLSVLAVKLEIKNPTVASQEQPVLVPVDLANYQVREDCLNSVQFKLDDGSCIEADRDFLCEKSEYFKCLLSGVFKESGENVVTLQNVPSNALKLLLLLLQFGVNNTEVYKIEADLELLLDVIILSESYLLSDLCNCVTLSVQYFKLLPSTLPTIYQWSLESGTDILRVESIAYALVAKINESERNRMCLSLLSLGCTDKIADDIRKLLVRFLAHGKYNL